MNDEQQAAASRQQAAVDPLTIGELLSLQEAAAYCGLSKRSLQIYARHGRLKSKKIGTQWVTTRAAIDEYMSSRRPTGLFKKGQKTSWVHDEQEAGGRRQKGGGRRQKGGGRRQKGGDDPLTSGELITLQEAAKYAGLAKDSIHAYIKKGRLKGVRRGWMWFTTYAAVDEYLQSRNPNRIPRKNRRGD